jgi:hypothetical protein
MRAGAGMQARDSIATIAAIGLLAYVAADVAHHALGHGAACIALGGRVASLSSTFVDCTLRGSAIDLAGPLASLVAGAAAMAWLRIATRLSPAARLFWILAAAFNLFWFALQLVSSAATRTDDWAWAMHEFHATELARYGLIATGLAGYAWVVRACATWMAPFASSRARAGAIALVPWLAAGAIACATALLDRHAGPAMFRLALAQSMGLAIGLLFVPRRAAKIAPAASAQAEAIGFSLPWVATAAIAGVGSILLLGPGIAT